MPKLKRNLFFATVLFLLVRCTTTHQLRHFPPYFAMVPEGHFNQENLSEMRELEMKPALTLLEKRRLWALYNVELTQTKEGTERHETLTTQVASLQTEIEALEREVASLRDEINSYEPVEAKTTNDFKLPSLKKAYSEAQVLWNRDENELALKKIDEVLQQWPESASENERYRFVNLKLRIALEENNLPVAHRAYLDLKSVDGCGTTTAEASLFLSLLTFASGDAKSALSIFEGQCDPDESPPNAIKRKYWKARFGEVEGPLTSARLYQELIGTKLPGYYTFVSYLHLGKPIDLSAFFARLPFSLPGEFDIPRKVHHYLLVAEERIAAKLRRDASIYLQSASHILKKKLGAETFVPLLYIAHLFRAAGEHLQAMKIYAILNTLLLEEKETWPAVVSASYFSDMYPRPFLDRVEWLSRMWGVDSDFVYSIMRQESAFNPAAVSVSDARGVMQLMPSLAKSLSKEWKFQPYYADKALFNAEENLKLAVYHLRQLQDLFQHPALVAAAYNAGISRVKKWEKKMGALPLDMFIERIPIAETRGYVKLVLRNYIYYKALRTGGSVSPGLISPRLPQAVAGWIP